MNRIDAIKYISIGEIDVSQLLYLLRSRIECSTSSGRNNANDIFLNIRNADVVQSLENLIVKEQARTCRINGD